MSLIESETVFEMLDKLKDDIINIRNILNDNALDLVEIKKKYKFHGDKDASYESIIITKGLYENIKDNIKVCNVKEFTIRKEDKTEMWYKTKDNYYKDKFRFFEYLYNICDEKLITDMEYINNWFGENKDYYGC